MKNFKIIGNISNGSTLDDKLALAKRFTELGADEILYVCDSEVHDHLDNLNNLIKDIEIPVNVRGFYSTFDDIKYVLYTGVARILFEDKDENNKSVNIELVKDSSLRFGEDRLYAAFASKFDCSDLSHAKEFKLFGVGGFCLDCIDLDNISELSQYISDIEKPVYLNTCNFFKGMSIDDKKLYIKSLKDFEFAGIIVDCDSMRDEEFILWLRSLINDSAFCESSDEFCFKSFKLNSDGLIPVIVQDYKTEEVLMMAYMNEEAYNKTLETRTMTYYSRSRQSLWIKGETSGHFQYVKKLCIDCDNDTLLAKVEQIGAACHTGNRTCFYTDILDNGQDDINPLKVFEEEYDIILDRKNNPKEGSYTNYLFDKGIDKILKKVGEEATEIIIAAKNPDKEEIKYELADFLYHAMVLMVEKNVTWDEVVEAIAKRR